MLLRPARAAQRSEAREVCRITLIRSESKIQNRKSKIDWVKLTGDQFDSKMML
jgi:hypothetical protein